MRTFLLALVLAGSACVAHSQLAPAASEEAFQRYVHGESLDQVAAELQIDNRDDVRASIRHTLHQLQVRFYRSE